MINRTIDLHGFLCLRWDFSYETSYLNSERQEYELAKALLLDQDSMLSLDNIFEPRHLLNPDSYRAFVESSKSGSHGMNAELANVVLI